MAKCLNCTNEVTGSSKYCSKTCKTIYNRNKCYGENLSVTNTPETVTEETSPLPANFGEVDCTCLHCQANRMNGNNHTINHGAYKSSTALAKNEINRVPLPGDVDYRGCLLCNHKG